MDFNAITTEDGYFYTEQRNGWYTDGDVEFDYNNTDIVGIVWQPINGFYCADGDGIVVVAFDGHGNYMVTDQGDPISTHATLREALLAAQRQLATEYPAIYEAAIA
jgi:hypothetical protein